jgi:O-antigen ligase
MVYVAVFCIVVVMVATWLSPGQGNRLDTLGSRLALWKVSAMMIEDFPLTGIGAGQYGAVQRVFYPLGMLEPTVSLPHAHSFYLQMCIEFGVPFTVAFLAALSILSLRLRVIRPEALSETSISLGMLASILSFLIYGIADAISIGSRGGIYIWAVFSLARYVSRLQ